MAVILRNCSPHPTLHSPRRSSSPSSTTTLLPRSPSPPPGFPPRGRRRPHHAKIRTRGASEPFVRDRSLGSSPASSRLRKVIRTKFLTQSLLWSKATSIMVDHEGEAVATAPTSGSMIFQPILEDGVFRFDCSENDRKAAFPSLSFVDTNSRDRPILLDTLPEFVPSFNCISGQQIVKFVFPAGSSMYGTGEVSGPLERTGTRVFTWNTDAWGYGSGTASLYQSHPWVFVLLPDGKAFGILVDTTRRCEIDLCEKYIIKFAASTSYPVITFGPHNSSTAVLMSLSRAIGTVFMPPKWSLGHHQCRFSYVSDAKVLQVARTFRDKGIPCDVIWMDIDYMDDYRCFTFDKENFPDPKLLAKELHCIGFKAIWMLDPGIKHETSYAIYDSGTRNDVWVLKDDGKPFIGKVWPGPCVFPDFTQRKVRSWWAKLVEDFSYNGVDGIWNDMNEPAVFETVTKTMPKTNIHRGDAELGGHQAHSHYHNAYGMLMARSTYEGMQMGKAEKRPFVLSRAGFIGSQRYAATWTGDNLANWEHLHMSISMVLQLGLSGQPFSGPDIGGFIGNTTPKLFARWLGIGAMFPFCRIHTEKGTVDHEPWSFGEECEEVCRLALLRRYRFLPHIYSLFFMAHTKGCPVAVPIFFADPTNPGLRANETSFLLGSLLVCASTVPEKGSDELPDVLPKGIWLLFDFGDSHPDLPNLYLQGGAIIPVGPPLQHVGEINFSEEVSLLIALDEHGKAEGFLYEDDGDGYEFTKGTYLLTYYVAELQSSVVKVKISRTEGSWMRPRRALHGQLLLGGHAVISATGIDGEELHIKMPSKDQVATLVRKSENLYRSHIENVKRIPDVAAATLQIGELSKMPVELKNGDWHLKVVPGIGGRIISMIHVPSDFEWLCGELEADGYKEYSGLECNSSGTSENYIVTGSEDRQPSEEGFLRLEGDISGGLVIKRQICIPKHHSAVLQIDSSIVAENVGAGSGGFSRLVCLRVHPQFQLQGTEVFISFISLDGMKNEFRPQSGEIHLEGNHRPNGEWMLVDRSARLSLVNRFDLLEVKKCRISWNTGTVTMELVSEERPVSRNSPLKISHQYEVKEIT